jgi:hypothetical protein
MHDANTGKEHAMHDSNLGFFHRYGKPRSAKRQLWDHLILPGMAFATERLKAVLPKVCSENTLQGTWLTVRFCCRRTLLAARRSRAVGSAPISRGHVSHSVLRPDTPWL